MKKLVLFMLALICLLSLVGCNAQQAKPLSKYLKEKDGEQYLLLPKSKKHVLVYREYRQFLENIDVDMLKTAEEKLRAHIPPNEYDPWYYLDIEEGIMYLCVEIMVDIDPPKTITDENGYEYTSGCGIDHDHVRYDEPISPLILKLVY